MLLIVPVWIEMGYLFICGTGQLSVPWLRKNGQGDKEGSREQNCVVKMFSSLVQNVVEGMLVLA